MGFLVLVLQTNNRAYDMNTNNCIVQERKPSASYQFGSLIILGSLA